MATAAGRYRPLGGSDSRGISRSGRRNGIAAGCTEVRPRVRRASRLRIASGRAAREDGPWSGPLLVSLQVSRRRRPRERDPKWRSPRLALDVPAAGDATYGPFSAADVPASRSRVHAIPCRPTTTSRALPRLMPYPLVSLESIPPIDPYLSNRGPWGHTRRRRDAATGRDLCPGGAAARGGSVLLVARGARRDAGGIVGATHASPRRKTRGPYLRNVSFCTRQFVISPT